MKKVQLNIETLNAQYILSNCLDLDYMPAILFHVLSRRQYIPASNKVDAMEEPVLRDVSTQSYYWKHSLAPRIWYPDSTVLYKFDSVSQCMIPKMPVLL